MLTFLMFLVIKYGFFLSSGSEESILHFHKINQSYFRYQQNKWIYFFCTCISLETQCSAVLYLTLIMLLMDLNLFRECDPFSRLHLTQMIRHDKMHKIRPKQIFSEIQKRLVELKSSTKVKNIQQDGTKEARVKVNQVLICYI